MRRAAGLTRRLAFAASEASALPAATLGSTISPACDPAASSRLTARRHYARKEYEPDPVFEPIHIQDEAFCRQRQLVPLGHREPILAPDTWIAPNAVCIGDCDLFDKARP